MARTKMPSWLSTSDGYRPPVVFILGDGSSFMAGADLRVVGRHCVL